MSARAIRPGARETNGAAPASGGSQPEPFQVLVDARPPAPAPPVTPAVRVIESPPGPDGRPRAPRREVEVAIDGYPGFTCWLWSSYSQRLRAEFTCEDEARIRAALSQVLVEHNGWSDENGEPYPAADDPTFWHVIPQELAILIVKAVVEAPLHYPNSVLARPRR